MEKRNNTGKAANKGFTLHLGDTYIGYLTLNEKNADPAIVAAMQDPDNMLTIIEDNDFELRPYVEKEDADMSNIAAILAAKQAQQQTVE